MSQPAPRPRIEPQPSRVQWHIFTVVTVLNLAVFTHPVAVLGGYVLHRWANERRALKIALLGVSPLSVFWLCTTDSIFVFHPTAPIARSFPVMPLVAVLIAPLGELRMFLKPRSADEMLEEEKEKLAQWERRAGVKADQRNQNLSGATWGEVRIGAYIKGDMFENQIDGIRFRNGFLSIDEIGRNEHMFIVGASGSGKTETLNRIIYEAIHHTDSDLIIVDGKGEDEWAQQIRAMCFAGGRGNTPIFRMGYEDADGHPYNGFCGSAKAIWNRLVAMVGVAESEGGATYYADINRDLLQLVCYAPGGPPRSFREVRQRLRKKWLLQAWHDDPDEIADIKELDRRDIQGLLKRIKPLAREFARLIQPNGFTLEDSRSAIFSIKAHSATDSSKRLLKFLIEDVKDYLANRKDRDRPALLIIDEFGLFDNENIAAVLQLGRSAGLAVVLATQDVSTLESEQVARKILANTSTKFLMRAAYPEEVASTAGSVSRVAMTLQQEEGAPTGLGTVGFKDVFKVDLNQVRKQQKGEGFLIRYGHAAKVKVPLVERTQLEQMFANLPAEAQPETRAQPAEAVMSQDKSQPIVPPLEVEQSEPARTTDKTISISTGENDPVGTYTGSSNLELSEDPPGTMIDQETDRSDDDSNDTDQPIIPPI